MLEIVKNIFYYLLLFCYPLLIILAVNVYLYLLDMLLGKQDLPFLQKTLWGIEMIGRRYFPKVKVTKIYAARVLIQHLLTPETSDYSSFSEVVLLGKLAVPADTDFSTAFFDDNQDLIDQVAQHLKPHLETSYPNANGQTLTTRLVKICQLTEVLDQVTFQGEVLEISDRLYTFTRKISLEEFLNLYEVGLEGDDD